MTLPWIIAGAAAANVAGMNVPEHLDGPDDEHWDSTVGWRPVILGVPTTSGTGDACRWSPEPPVP